MLGQFWKEESAESDDYNIVTLYNRTGLRVLKARSLPTMRINMARCGENVTCRQTNDDSDTSVHDKYIAAAISERQESDDVARAFAKYKIVNAESKTDVIIIII